MIVYTLEGSQGTYSDNRTWIEGVFATTGEAMEWVRLRPLSESAQWEEASARQRQWTAEWAEDKAAESFANRRRWRCVTHDPGDWEDIDWVVDEWQVGQPAGPKPSARPCEVCQRALITHPDPEVIYCGRRDCVPVALQTGMLPYTQPARGGVLRKPRERKLE